MPTVRTDRARRSVTDRRATMRAALRPSLLAVLLAVLIAACSAPPTDGPTATTDLEAACEGAGPVPSGITIDAFYAQYCTVSGLAILASDEVPASALQHARTLIATMLENVDPRAIDEIVDADVRIGVIAEDQVTTDLPEHADLNDAFPGTDWDAVTRGVAATVARPLTSAAEENLLCYPGDGYAGESILIHEFAHTVHELGVARVDATFDARLEAAYDGAMAGGLWDATYAAENELEYWAEGVQSYFDANGSADPPDGIHNDVDTRSELASYDPALYALVDEVFGGTASPDACP